ncbi:MAG: bifunctional demethylmenaquinone methyltransferase/2-methoxy-6-polyprenyl-1,4-benzoquinol methylase UbiE [Bacteroidetes bacterium]|nr:bifunctional demethylmenaquinone methyltransferase/2-methoxy-6-polyprenyl-1,4-benzoquinol methylase UbiE [Bacteroidota bacterium]
MSTAVKPNPASEASKKQQVEEMFDSISHRYDFLNHFLSLGIDRGWRKKVRKLMAGFGHTRLLDVATGTADLAIELAKIPGVNITGVDISRGMLAKGDEKLKTLGLNSRIVLQVADSEKLPYDDESFDGITVAFGVRNFENLEKGLSEMQRVLTVGGHLMILEFSKPRNPVFSALYWFYFKTILPVAGRLFSKSSNAYTYLPQSVAAFPEGEKMVEILNNCGYRNVSFKPLTMGVCTLYICEK